MTKGGHSVVPASHNGYSAVVVLNRPTVTETHLAVERWGQTPLVSIVEGVG
jgi:hypothetical protein